MIHNARPHPTGGFFRQLSRYRVLLLMLLPAVAFTVVFSYIPMAGAVLGFKRYDYSLGIFNSPWVGLDNFRFFFLSGQAARITMNTVLYNAFFIFFGHVVAIALAVFLSEMRNKYFVKTAQTMMFLPHFVSWVIVGSIVYNLLNTDYGLVNTIRASWGMERFAAYVTPSFWPPFLVLISVWKGAGYSSVVYLAAITGVDQEIYESAKIDGANIWQRTFRITIPCIRSMIILQLLFAIGGIFRGDFGMFYNIVGNNSLLYNATDVIDTVVFRSLVNTSNLGMSTAIGLFQSLLCFVTIMATNLIIRRIEPESALF